MRPELRSRDVPGKLLQWRRQTEGAGPIFKHHARLNPAAGDHLIVIPVFNEAATVGDIVERARLHGPVLVVDDGSTDRSAALAVAAGAEVVSLGRRRGKGAALRRAFAEALERRVEWVVTLDGDGQHDPDDIPRLLKAAVEEPRALVIGGRLGRLAEAPARVMPAGRLAALRVAGFSMAPWRQLPPDPC